MKNLVRSLRHLGPTYMLKWQWITTQGKVPNTLTRLLWNRRVVSMPFNEFMAPAARDVFNTLRILRLQNMWRHWAPSIPVPTFDYLQNVPAFWMEDDRPDVIPLALIMIWETKDEAGKKEMLSLMKTVNAVINRETEFKQKQAAFDDYMINFNKKLTPIQKTYKFQEKRKLLY